MTFNDLVGDNQPGLVWKLQDQIAQAARKYQRVRIGGCTDFHLQTFLVGVVEGCLDERIVVVAWVAVDNVEDVSLAGFPCCPPGRDKAFSTVFNVPQRANNG